MRDSAQTSPQGGAAKLGVASGRRVQGVLDMNPLARWKRKQNNHWKLRAKNHIGHCETADQGENQKEEEGAQKQTKKEKRRAREETNRKTRENRTKHQREKRKRNKQEETRDKGAKGKTTQGPPRKTFFFREELQNHTAQYWTVGNSAASYGGQS